MECEDIDFEPIDLAVRGLADKASPVHIFFHPPRGKYIARFQRGGTWSVLAAWVDPADNEWTYDCHNGLAGDLSSNFFGSMVSLTESPECPEDEDLENWRGNLFIIPY